MQAKNSTSTSTSTVLIVIVVMLTFPLWIGLIGGIFGLIGGLFGIIAGIFATIFGAIGNIFGWMFDSTWGCSFDYNPELWVVLVVIAVILIASKSRKN